MLLNTRPKDWPAEGELIDLKQHDLPHRSSSTEWWYMHAHLDGKNEKGEPRKLAMFASFFFASLKLMQKRVYLIMRILSPGPYLTWITRLTILFP